MRKLLRFGRFNLVGAMGMLVQLGAVWALNRMGPGHVVAVTLAAVELAVLHNFAWHVRYTWRDRRQDRSWKERLLRFQLSNGSVSLVGNALLMRILVGVAAWPVPAANVVAIACCSVVNFWLGDVWAFQGAIDERTRAARLAKAVPLICVVLLVCQTASGQRDPEPHVADVYGADCAYSNWFVGPSLADGGRARSPTFTGGVTIGQYFARTLGRGVMPSPQFELGVVGPLPRGKHLDGLVSVNFMFASKVPRRSLYPSLTAGYTRMFVTGNAVDFGLGIDFGKNEYKRLVRIELRDYYLFSGPRQHIFGLRVGLGSFLPD